MVGAGMRDPAQIITRPDKFVDLGYNGPGRIIIEAQVPLDGGRNFNGAIRNLRRTMRNRYDGYENRPVIVLFNTQNNDCRAVFFALLIPRLAFIVPKVAV
jgi:hypothetical protein